MAAGSNPNLNLGIKARLSGFDDLLKQLKEAGNQIRAINKANEFKGFGYTDRLFSGQPVTSSQRRAAFAEMDYARQVWQAQTKERMRGAQTPAEMQAVKQRAQIEAQQFSSARSLGRLAPPANSGFSALGAGMAFARGILGVSAIASTGYWAGTHLKRLYEGELDREQSVSNVMNRLAPAGTSIGSLYNLTRGGGVRAGMGPEEFTKFLGQMGGIAGATATPLASQAAQLARVFGLAPGKAADVFGSAARLGADTVASQKKFADMIAEAVQHGRLRGREGEVFESILKSTEAVSGFLGLSRDENMNVSANIAKFIGRMSDSRIPGLEGGAAGSALMAAQSAITGTPLFNMPNLIRPLMASMMLGRGMDPYQMEMLRLSFVTGSGVKGDNGPDRLMGMFKGAGNLGRMSGMRDGPAFFQLMLSEQLGMGALGPKMVAAMNGPHPQEDSKRVYDEYIKQQNAATDMQKKLASFHEAEAKVGAALVPIFDKLAGIIPKVNEGLDLLAKDLPIAAQAAINWGDFIAKSLGFKDITEWLKKTGPGLIGAAPGSRLAIEEATTLTNPRKFMHYTREDADDTIQALMDKIGMDTTKPYMSHGPLWYYRHNKFMPEGMRNDPAESPAAFGLPETEANMSVWKGMTIHIVDAHGKVTAGVVTSPPEKHSAYSHPDRPWR